MNTCSDCRGFEDCLETGQAMFPGDFICGEFRPIEDYESAMDRKYHELKDEDKLDRFGSRKIDIDDLIYDKEEG